MCIAEWFQQNRAIMIVIIIIKFACVVFENQMWQLVKLIIYARTGTFLELTSINYKSIMNLNPSEM